MMILICLISYIAVAQVANSPLSPQSFQVPSPSSSADLLVSGAKAYDSIFLQ